MTRRRAAPLALLMLLLAACAVQAPPSGDRSTGPSSEPPPSPSRPTTAATATAEPSPAATLATPGLPYAAADLLAAMLGSRRPGGVPDALETDAVATALAEQLWTWDGQPWDVVAVSGACGPDACSLEVAGAPGGGTAGDDLYTFDVDPSTGSLEIAATDLHGYPAALMTELDRSARAALDASALDGLSLVAARWLPPPETDRYWLAYRSGGEEGSPRTDVLLDLARGEVIRVERG